MAKRFTGTVHVGGEQELGSAAGWMHRCRRRIIDRSVDDAAAFCVPAIGKILPRLAAG
ncbi:hypothetical protein [Glutamicibacter sp. HZAU]|uniref:hypothetical protein n=1 Tax=Glutamicibacter sp. HZAU TaxID=2049891 RepID=UPI00137601CB|nr:hypothetical protein [Glutamicibacter sp. HZAU]